MPDPANQGDRAKAYRLRKEAKKGKLAPVDALWLGEYDEKAEARAKASDRGASRWQSGRKVKFEMEEHEEAEAVGTGAAAAAAAQALAAREEGRRLDSLTVEAVGALKAACDVYRDVCLSMKERMEVLEGTHIEMLGAVRDQYLARTQAEINAMEAASQGGDEISQIAKTLLPDLLGLKNGKPAA
jgi:hypothetical protein